MATVSVLGVKVFGFPVDTEVTAPDGNTYMAIANMWYGVSKNYVDLDWVMAVTPAGKMICFLDSGQKDTERNYNQVMTPDVVRVSA